MAAVIPHSRASALLLLLAKTNEQHYDVTSDGIMVTTSFKKDGQMAQNLK